MPSDLDSEYKRAIERDDQLDERRTRMAISTWIPASTGFTLPIPLKAQPPKKKQAK